jgi:phage-related protein
MENLTNTANNLAQSAVSSATNMAKGALSSVPGAGSVDAVRNALKGLENGAVDPKALLDSLKSKLPIPPKLPEIPKKPNLKVLKFKAKTALFNLKPKKMPKTKKEKILEKKKLKGLANQLNSAKESVLNVKNQAEALASKAQGAISNAQNTVGNLQSQAQNSVSNITNKIGG